MVSFGYEVSGGLVSWAAALFCSKKILSGAISTKPILFVIEIGLEKLI